MQVMSTVTALPDARNPRHMVAAQVRALLGWRDMNQSQLAQILGISQPQLSKRLKGTIPFDLDELVLMAQYFGVTVGHLFGESGNTGPTLPPKVNERYPLRLVS